jgi:hypothetical protein
MNESKVLYFIFGDARTQSDDDLEDMCLNILHFNDKAQIIINHPTATHENVKLRHIIQPVNQSTFIFGAFIELLKYIDNHSLEFDHLCLYSANQYMINHFMPIKGINYLQFYNCPDWDYKYTGKDFTNLRIGNPLIQYGTFNWDPAGMDQILSVDGAMVSNWEFAHLTNETIKLCTQYINECIKIYPNQDKIQTFPGYMAIKTGQPWLFPPFFGTFDPSNRINGHNWIITEEQINQKFKEGYASVKRVNYTKDCPLKSYIKEHII